MDIEKLSSESLPDELIKRVAKIDQQHLALIKIISHLSNCMREGMGKDKIEDVLKFLKGYVEIHFSTEEEYMRKTNYHGFRQHKEQHDQFKVEVLNII